MRTRFVVLSGLVLAGGALGACGSSDDTTAATTATASSSSTTIATTTSSSAGGNGGASSSSSNGGGGATSSTGGATTSATGGGGASTGGGGATGGDGGAGGSTFVHGTCAAPTVIADGATVSGDTTGAMDNVDTPNTSCQKGGAPDDVYQVTVADDGVLDITLDSDADMGIVARATCSDASTEIACEDKVFGGETEHLTIPVTSGETVVVVVDGFTAMQFGPYTLTVKSRTPMCGDGVVDPGEDCDPPDGTSCDATCHFIPETNCTDGIDNDGNGDTDCLDVACAATSACPNAMICANATAIVAGSPSSGDTTATQDVFEGSCTGADANEQIFDFAPAVDGVLSLTLDSSADLGVYQRLVCNDASSELLCVDKAAGNQTEKLEAAAPAGVAMSYFVDGFGSDASAFTLTNAFTPTTEAEPNNNAATALTLASGAPAIGILYPAGDEDWYALTLGATQTTIAIATNDLGTGACAAHSLDTYVELYDGATMIDANDDTSSSYCAALTHSGLTGGSTYFVRVETSPTSLIGKTMGYKITLTGS